MNIQLAQQMYNLKEVSGRLHRSSEDRPEDYDTAIHFVRKLVATSINLAETLEALAKAREYGG